MSQICEFIIFVTAHSLANAAPPKGFELIADLLKEKHKFDIVTLNHDCLIETVLKNKSLEPGVDYIDGFAKPNGQLRFFEPATFEKENAGKEKEQIDGKLRLLKLHGSVDWHLYKSVSGNRREECPAIPVGDASGPHHDSTGAKWENWLGRPQLLVGSFNKFEHYSYGPFREMDVQFHKLLSKHSKIVMSGYGGCDDGINVRLRDWLRSSGAKRLAIANHVNIGTLGKR